MPKGIALNIGLNGVDPAHYGGWPGTLKGCEADAADMGHVARAAGFEVHQLLTQSATSANVTAAITDASRKLDTGDIFFLSYSGHGGQVPDTNNDEVQDDLDETWVLYDRQFIDDELYALWAMFKPGVRILVLSDSCHSGSVVRRLQELSDILTTDTARSLLDQGIAGTRALPPDVGDRNYRDNEAMYKDIQNSVPDGDKAVIAASVILISGCQDDQLSADGKKNGLFTQTLLKVWNNGTYKGSYRKFRRDIVTMMPMWQVPNFYRTGKVSHKFEGQRPFTI